MGSLYFLLTFSVFADGWADREKKVVDLNVQNNFDNQAQVGVVVGVVHGKNSYVWSYGEIVNHEKIMPDADTYFEIGSITKTFTTTLLAIEIGRGRVKLDTKVSELWSDLVGTDVGTMTLLELATHHSGLPGMPDNFAPSDLLNPYKDYSEKKLFDFLKRFKRTGVAPYPFEYSNLGMGLLGYLLSEKIHGKSFKDYVTQELLRPLGMNATRISVADIAPEKKAQGYNEFLENMPFWDLNVLEPAGVIKSTASDMLKYLKFQMSSEDSLLVKAKDMTHLNHGTLDGDFFMGLGWQVGKIQDHEVVTHSGATGGYRANLMVDKKNQLGVIVLSNTAVSPSCIISGIFDVPCEFPRWEHFSKEFLETFSGYYFCEELQWGTKIFLKNDILSLRGDGQSVLRLWSKSKMNHVIPDVGADLVFHQDPKGSIDGFVLNQNGKNREFKRKLSSL